MSQELLPFLHQNWMAFSGLAAVMLVYLWDNPMRAHSILSLDPKSLSKHYNDKPEATCLVDIRDPSTITSQGNMAHAMGWDAACSKKDCAQFIIIGKNYEHDIEEKAIALRKLFENAEIFVLKGGMKAWIDDGYPVLPSNNKK